MRYKLTQHAQDALMKRGIPLEWLERALFFPQKREPDLLDPELEHRLLMIAEHGQRVLRVIVNKEVTPERVITAYFDRSMREKI